LAEIKIRVERVEASRLSEEVTNDSEAVYKVNVSLAERERTSGTLALDFTLELTAQPEVARLRLVGVAEIEAQRDELRSMLKSEDPKAPPPILAKIYERLYGTLYLLCDVLRVPHPLPSLLRAPGPTIKPEPKAPEPKAAEQKQPEPKRAT
jgi:hypothetical protein